MSMKEMKRFLLVFSCIFMFMASSNAQVLTKEWVFPVEGQLLIHLDKGNQNVVELTGGAQYNCFRYSGFAAMAGLSYTSGQKDICIPIIIRWEISDHTKEMSPFFKFDVGGVVNTKNSDGNVTRFSATIGYRLNDEFSIGVGYTMQFIDSSITNDNDSKWINVKLTTYF